MPSKSIDWKIDCVTYNTFPIGESVMRPLTHFLQVLSDEELDRLHDAALGLLNDPGMRIENNTALEALGRRGAKVEGEQVRFPRDLVEETLRIAQEEEQQRFAGGVATVDAPNALTFSWHTPFRERTSDLVVSMGGGCPRYYDHERREARLATADDFLRMVHLAEGIPEIITMGNAVHYLKESDGSLVSPPMVAIRGAATVAKHSSKPGCTAIMDHRQLQFLMEIGIIVKGSAEEYMRHPILVNIHDTEPPLRVTRPEAAIMVEMAGRGLSIFILPMPMTGIAGPVYLIANAMIGAAEILGVWTMAKAIRMDAPVEAAITSGVLNPKSGAVCFSGPEPMLQDLAVAQLFRERYGLRCGTGSGFIDAPVPGLLALYERMMKSCSASLAGEPIFNAGILGGGILFSPEQLMLDMDMLRGLAHFCSGIGGDRFDESLKLIREQGIGGLFIDTEHTAKYFRECLWVPSILERFSGTEFDDAAHFNPVGEAFERWQAILKDTAMYTIDYERGVAIDEVVDSAQRMLDG
jgi:trimethylamine--corrinoid protein Co-methyltransferase